MVDRRGGIFEIPLFFLYCSFFVLILAICSGLSQWMEEEMVKDGSHRLQSGEETSMYYQLGEEFNVTLLNKITCRNNLIL